ncbi:MAG: sensor histidine kinase [Clostridium sp.]
MIYIIIVLAIVIFTLIIYIISTKKELKNISKQIEDNKGKYINVHTKGLDSGIEEIVCKVNYLYDESQKINAKNKNIEEEIRRSIANMAHDLRTPLTSICGYIQLIKSERTTESEKKEYIEIVERRTKRLESLITSFYDLSRLNSNEYNFKLEKVNLSKILCDNIALYYNEFMKKNIEPIIEIDDNISSIIADEEAVNRIFSNLIGNMIKHGKDNIKISLVEKDGYILSEFINHAPNIDDDVVEKIFDRFYTADKSRSSQNTGLGLSITKAFVVGLGSEINGKVVDKNLNIYIKWKK